MAKSIEEIEQLLQNTRFRHRLLGGVDEEDVWKKLARLHNEYQELVEVECQQARGAINEWKRYAGSLENQLREREEQLDRLARLAAEQYTRLAAGRERAGRRP